MPVLSIEDVWLVHADTMDRLRAQPNFVAAQRRLADAQGQQCMLAERHFWKAAGVKVQDFQCCLFRF